MEFLYTAMFMWAMGAVPLTATEQFMPRIISIDQAQSTISVNKSQIVGNGTDVCTVSVTLRQTRTNQTGQPLRMAGLGAGKVQIVVTPSTGVIVSQPTGRTSPTGITQGSFVITSSPTTLTISAVALGVTLASTTVTVVAESEPTTPSELWPNEPAGMTNLVEWLGTPVGTTNALGVAGASSWFRFDGGIPEATLVTDATNPTNSGYAVRVATSNPGGGTGAGDVFRPFGGGGLFNIPLGTQNYTEVYIAHYWRQNQPVPLKFYYLRTLIPENRPEVWTARDAWSQDGVKWLRAVEQRLPPPNTAQSVLAAQPGFANNGAWELFEFYFKAESSPGAGDGVARSYYNGQLIQTNNAVTWGGPEWATLHWYAPRVFDTDFGYEEFLGGLRVSARRTTSEPVTFGRGSNAPDWENTTTYPTELFAEELPVRSPGSPGGQVGPANPAGFEGVDGFDNDGYYAIDFVYKRSSYPTVETPLGTKQVLRVSYPGSSGTISANGGTSQTWNRQMPWAVSIKGTWVGTLAFEISDDNGATWSPFAMTSSPDSPVPNVEQTETTINAIWRSNGGGPDFAGTNGTSDTGLFRVRATSWTSGTATVAIGMKGGWGPARFDAGTFSGDPTRIYTRVLYRVDPQYTNGGNAGTKFFFFSQQQNTNHYFNLSSIGMGLQGSTFLNIDSTVNPTYGTWIDMEVLIIANTPGVSDGILKVWVNGQLGIDRTDIPYFGTTANGEPVIPRFTGFFVDPTYGGGRNPPPLTTYFDIAGWYRESAP
jgi:hypothetical protein